MPEITDIRTKPLQTVAYILLPVLIGLTVICYLFWKEFDPHIFTHVSFSLKTTAFVAIAVIFMLGRDAGLIWRYRRISGNTLSWWQAIRVNILCEFTSAVTPSAVGGSSLIVVFLNKEGINAGRSTANDVCQPVFRRVVFRNCHPDTFNQHLYTRTFRYNDNPV